MAIHFKGYEEESITGEVNGLHRKKELLREEKQIVNVGTDYSYKHKYVWSIVIAHFILQCAAVYGLFVVPSTQWRTILAGLVVYHISGFGSTIAAHRLYAHRSFKATFGLRVILMLLQTLSGQNTIYTWVRDHRLHHKYSDTDADPHNSNRGFFFSHMGWLMMRKHPEVIAKGRQIDLSDLLADKIVMFQKRYYMPLYILCAIGVPVGIPVYFFNESFRNAFFVNYILRYVLTLHITWFVNSYAHFYGTKPYDKFIKPSETWFVTFFTMGEGWHNYHHVFPWDYRAAELGFRYNISAWIIQGLSYLGLTYDLKTVPKHIVKQRMSRTGSEFHNDAKQETAVF